MRQSKKDYYQDYLYQKKNQSLDFRYKNIIFEDNNHYIYVVFSVGIFSFDENQKPTDNSPVSCVLKKYYCFFEENRWVSNTPSSSRRYAPDSSPTASFANGYNSLIINSL